MVRVVLPTLFAKYQITLDLYLSEDNDGDSNKVGYMRQNFAAVHTLPTKENGDRPYFNPETKTLVWDFKKFSDQDCASPKPAKIQRVPFHEGDFGPGRKH